MSPLWTVRVFAIATVVLVLAVPAASVAQDDGEAIPFTTSGVWFGLLDVSGHTASDYEGEHGFSVTVTDVIGDTSIPVDLTVGQDGRVTGTMTVNLEYFTESAGAASNGDPFHVLADHQATGSFVLSGTASELVAKGVLSDAVNTFAEGERVQTPEEISRECEAAAAELEAEDALVTFECPEMPDPPPDRDVEWAFRVTETSCTGVIAELVRVSGSSFLVYALMPPVYDDGAGTIRHNELEVRLHLWPETLATPEGVEAAIEEVTQRADELKAREFPEASHMLDLIDAWTDLQAELAALNECETAQVFRAPLLDRPWLVKVLRGALGVALESPDHYDASELVDLWDVGKAESAVDADLTIAFIDAFDDKLDEAIADGDIATIETVRGWASENGYAQMEEKASAS